MYKRRKPINHLSRKQLKRIAQIESQNDIVELSLQQHSDDVGSRCCNTCRDVKHIHSNALPESVSDHDELDKEETECNNWCQLESDSSGSSTLLLDDESFMLSDNDNELLLDQSEELCGLGQTTNLHQQGSLKPDVGGKEALLSKEVANWALSNNISNQALSELLKILQSCGHTDLPSDARTLLNTPRSTALKKVHPGEYWHAGVAKSISDNNVLSQKILQSEGLTCIDLAIGFDGLPISKSSNSCLWPIFGKVLNVEGDNSFLIGSYHGQEKPESANEYMEQFINEFVEISETGLKIGDRSFITKIKYIICDAPAKSFILNIKGHSGYFSCTKCTIRGDSIQRSMCFANSQGAVKRTDTSFLQQSDKDYHMGPTDLVKIPNLGLVTNVPLDYMHLVCLGIMRKLLKLWIFGDKRLRAKETFYKLNTNQTNNISTILESFKCCIPKEFARRPRSLKEVKHWKATEYRQILLYTGIVAFKKSLHNIAYTNFIYIHVAIRILCNSKHCTDHDMLNYANELLEHFVTSFSAIYGKRCVSHNVHGLTHLVEDVRRFGPLDNFSAFSFENSMQMLKKCIRKSEKPLQQLSRRYFEKIIGNNRNMSRPTLRKNLIHFEGPLINDCTNPQYRRIMLKDTNIALDCRSLADSCCQLVDGSVIIVENIAMRSSELVIIGKTYQTYTNLFTDPCPSSMMDIHIVSNLLPALEVWPVDNIKHKLFKIPYEEDSTFVVLPILHSDMSEVEH